MDDRVQSSVPALTIGRRGIWRAAVLVMCLVVGGLLGGAAAAQSEDAGERIPDGVPEHCPALRAYAKGEILEVMEGGRLLKILNPSAGELPYGGGATDPRYPTPNSLRAPSADFFRGEQILILQDIQGWLFIDPPDGGPQERMRLDDGRREFARGQFIEVGPAPGLESRASEGVVRQQTTGSLGSAMFAGSTPTLRLTGWIYMRLNRYKQDDYEDGQQHDHD